jgi:hypothetical protein
VIKAAGKTAFGTDLLFLGLPELVVVISYGRTEQDILAELKASGVVLRGLPQ